MTISDRVRKDVLERDDFSCVSCGKSIIGRQYSLQHRRARKQGGARLSWIDQPQNLVTVCGSATSPDCHWTVMESRDPAKDAKTLGYVISEWPELDPRFIPVHVVREHGTVKVWLTPDGEFSDDPPADAPVFQDLVFCQACHVVKLHEFSDDSAACTRCGLSRIVTADLVVEPLIQAPIVPVVAWELCDWCKEMVRTPHACPASKSPTCPTASGERCGKCDTDLLAQARDPRYASPDLTP